MVHFPFDPRTVGYDDHHAPTSQTGGGADENYYYFRGLNPYQRGYGRQAGGGVGDVLRNFWRFLLPYAKRAGTAVAKEALDTGGRILESENEDWTDYLRRVEFQSSFGTGLRARANQKGLKRKVKPHQTFSKEKGHQLIIGKHPSGTTKKKRQKIDTFGLY
uniref:Uncharacterized protein n=1 Tax=Meloidogyne enterolobii TaxID=390850 RepID=A0A6V7X1L0_MELEN|nr:unnamed protein product [Meloidogyne enterolobii]CAD2195886.1 unnamed protein product [Meloidogyne enterolobii]